MDRYFNAFKSEERDWGFFIGLADYVSLLDEIEEIKPATKELTEKERKLIGATQDAEKLAVEELKLLSKKVLKEANKIETEEMKRFIGMFKEFNEGKLQPTWYHSARLQHGLYNIVKEMAEKNNEDKIKKLFPKDADLKTSTIYYDTCPAFSFRTSLSFGHKEQMETELWGITKDTYDKKHQEYQDQIQTLEIEMSEHQKADYDYQTTVATVVSVARRAKSIFDNSSEPARKRAFLNFFLQNPTVDGKKLEFAIASPFNLVLELADSPNWLPN